MEIKVFNMKKTLILIVIFSPIMLISQNIQQPCCGKIIHIDNFTSKYVKPRNIDIWLPDNYDGKTKFSVLYMHDGQMLFDSTNTWNHQAWDVDDMAAMLMKQGKVKNFIVVGIWNTDLRHPEYFPQKPYETLTIAQKDTITKQLKDLGRTDTEFQPLSDNYLKFIVEELKPYIDKNFSVYKNKNSTFIAGSSMGGLISMYAICEYPKIFGGAACMSTHWPGTHSIDNNPIPNAFAFYLDENLPNSKNHKIYFDYGDQTLDALYPPLQQKIDSVMIKNGYTESSWQTKFFPGKDHSEKSWKERLDYPILFLIKE